MIDQTEHVLQKLADVVKRIEDVLDTLPDEAKNWQPKADEWSVKMVVAHLLNCEPHFQKRLSRILAEENPTVPGFGPKEAPPQADLEFDELLAAYDRARQKTLEVVSNCSSKDWQRPAIHTVLGATTLESLIQLIVDHDTEHMLQLESVCAAWYMISAHR